MADWTDGPEYAPLERPDGFATPRTAPLAVVEPPPRPAEAQPQALPQGYREPEQARPLAQLVPHVAAPRDPELPFTGTGQVETGWGAAHGWKPTMPLAEVTGPDLPAPQGQPSFPPPDGNPVATARPTASDLAQLPAPTGAPVPLPPPPAAMPAPGTLPGQPTWPQQPPTQPQQQQQQQQQQQWTQPPPPVAQQPGQPQQWPAPQQLPAPQQPPAPQQQWPAQLPGSQPPAPRPQGGFARAFAGPAGVMLGALALGALGFLPYLMLILASLLSNRLRHGVRPVRVGFTVSCVLLVGSLVVDRVAGSPMQHLGSLGQWCCAALAVITLVATWQDLQGPRR